MYLKPLKHFLRPTVYDLQSQAADIQQPIIAHPLSRTRQTAASRHARWTVYITFLRTATVFVLLSAGVLHSCGHVVGGLHIWRTSHPETPLPWKI